MRFFWKKYYMRNLFLALLLNSFAVIGNAQEDTSLVNRLNVIFSFTQAKDFEKVMEYTYPKLFTIVPKKTMIATMKFTFDSEDFTIELDSIKILKIFPIFKINDTSYVKVRHTMLMKIKFLEPYDTLKKELKEIMVSFMSQKYGEENVRLDPVANSVNVFVTPDIVGIRDNISKWTFVNLNEDKPQILNMLFSKEVLDKLNEYK